MKSNEGYFSALIGRNSNRIENSELELGGKRYKLFANDGKNNLHGGKVREHILFFLNGFRSIPL